jgi:hypothetical protein
VDEEHKPANPRERRRREQRRLLWVVAGFLVLAGGAAIALAYGRRAIVLGVTCLFAGAGTLALLWGLLTVVERWLD